MTATRWDTRSHLDGDRHRKRPTTGRSYQPWHDVSMAVDGAAARALGELSRERWMRAGGTSLAAPAVQDDPWPEELKADFQNVEVAIARTRGAYRGGATIREIEALYLDLIASARRFIYAENQFFASRAIADAIAKRLTEPDGPEFVLINPRIVKGWLEEEAMSSARVELVKFLAEADRYGRFRIYTPVTECGTDIYVHSKLTIVDDEVLRVGSANMNNRSLGLDSECDLLINAAVEPNRDWQGTIARLRCDLMGEHLGVATEVVARAVHSTGSLIEAIESLAGQGRSLVALELDSTNIIEKKPGGERGARSGKCGRAIRAHSAAWIAPRPADREALRWQRSIGAEARL